MLTLTLGELCMTHSASLGLSFPIFPREAKKLFLSQDVPCAALMKFKNWELSC